MRLVQRRGSTLKEEPETVQHEMESGESDVAQSILSHADKGHSVSNFFLLTKVQG